MGKRLEAPDRIWIREDRYGIDLEGAYGVKPNDIDSVEYVRKDLAARPPSNVRTFLQFALANVESAMGRHLRGDLGRAASFIEDALKVLDGTSVPAQPGEAAHTCGDCGQATDKITPYCPACEALATVRRLVAEVDGDPGARRRAAEIMVPMPVLRALAAPGAPQGLEAANLELRRRLVTIEKMHADLLAATPSQDSQEVEADLETVAHALQYFGGQATYGYDTYTRAKEAFARLRALSQSPKGAAVCGTCGGSRKVDSGGQDGAGNWIERDCPECMSGEPSAPKPGLRGERGVAREAD